MALLTETALNKPAVAPAGEWDWLATDPQSFQVTAGSSSGWGENAQTSSKWLERDNLAYIDALRTLPGWKEFEPEARVATGGSIDNMDTWLDGDKVNAWLAERGYKLMGNNAAGARFGNSTTNANFIVDKDGKIVAAPDLTYDDPNGTMKAIALAAAGYFGGSALAGSGAGAAAGTTAAGTTATEAAGSTLLQQAGTQAAKQAAINAAMTAARGGNLNDVLKAGATGAVTGAVGGAVANAGWNPAVSGAVSNAAGTAIRGGDLKDVAVGAGTGALSGYVGQNGITGNQTIDRAIVNGGTALLKGGDVKTAVANGLLSQGLNSVLPGQGNGTANTLVPGGKTTFDVDLETPGINGNSDNGASNMSFNWNYDLPTQEPDLTGATDLTRAADPTEDPENPTDPSQGLDFGQLTGPGNDWGIDTSLDVGTTDGSPDSGGSKLPSLGDLFKTTKDGKLSVGGLDFTGGDLLKLLAGGMSGVWQKQLAEQKHQWDLDATKAKQEYDAKLLAEKFNRMRPAQSGLLNPSLVKIGG